MIGQETLNKIEAAIPVAQEYSLYKNWDGIHGIGHWKRTAILAYIIGSKTIMPEIEKDMVWATGLFHDLGRKDDSHDPYHGYRGVLPSALACSKLIGDRQVEMDLKQVGQMCECVARHQWQHNNDLPFWYDFVFDADKLELMRIRHDRLDPNRLYFNVSRELIPYAKKLQEEVA